MDNRVLRHGCPSYLLSDQSSKINGKVIREICDIFNIKKRRSSAYHSQGNGFAERSIRNIREMMRALLNDRKLPQPFWRQLLREINFALNTSVSESTKQTPYEVVYGKTAKLPIDVLMGIDKRDQGDFSTLSEYTTELKKRLTDTYEIVRRNLTKSREVMKRQYDKKMNVNVYNVGDKVWVKNKFFKSGVSKKLAPRKSGPWTVKEILQNGVDFKLRERNHIKS